MVLFSAEQAGKLKMMTYVLVGIFILHYANLCRMNHSYNGEDIRVKTEALLKDKTIPVVGMADNWFAAKDHDFHLIYNHIHNLVDRPFEQFYLVENEYLHIAPLSIKIENFLFKNGIINDALVVRRKKHYQNTISTFKKRFNCKKIGSFNAYLGQDAYVNICLKKPNN